MISFERYIKLRDSLAVDSSYRDNNILSEKPFDTNADNRMYI